MKKELIKFVEDEIKKRNFHSSKNAIPIDHVNIDKMKYLKSSLVHDQVSDRVNDRVSENF